MPPPPHIPASSMSGPVDIFVLSVHNNESELETDVSCDSTNILPQTFLNLTKV